jgi:hypothetical protein
MPSTRKVVLYGAHGQRRTLVCDDTGPLQLRPDNGLWGVAPVAITSRQVLGAAGEAIETVRTQPRSFAVPVLAQGSTEQAVDEVLGSLGSILDPNRDVRIVYSRPDGSAREITARYQSGGESLAVKSSHHNAVVVPLVFKAFYPFWRSADGVRVYSETMRDAGYADLNAVNITNAGDVDVWPEITINGYAENVECTSLNTGQVFRCRWILTEGETLRVDTDPRRFGVYLNEAQGYSTAMDPFSEFWPLQPGLNRLIIRGITFQRPGGRLTVRWREEWETV